VPLAHKVWSIHREQGEYVCVHVMHYAIVARMFMFGLAFAGHGAVNACSGMHARPGKVICK